MKAKATARRGRARKRDLFAELSEGMTALAEARQGKRTLRTHAAELRLHPSTPRELVRVGGISRSREHCLRCTCAPTSARWKTGSRDGRSRMRRRPC